MAAIAMLICLSGYPQEQNWFLSKVLNDNNGLPQNSITSLFFDRQSGFLWMTTQAGLVRYDGAATKVFDLRQLPPLKTVRMSRLFKTLDGKTRVCNWEGEVFAIEKNLPATKVSGMVQDTYVFGRRTGNTRTIRSLELEDTLFNNTETAPAIVQNSLWLDKLHVVAVSFNKVKFFRNNKLAAEWPVQFTKPPVLIERDGWVYAIEDSAHNFCFQWKSLQSAPFPAALQFAGQAHLFYDEGNRQPLLLKGNQLYELQLNGPQIQLKPLARLPQVPTDIKSIIYHPNKRFIFVATNSTGLHIYQQSPFRIYKVPGDNKLNSVYATCLIDSDRAITCRSLQFSLQNGTYKPLPIKLDHDRSLTLDSAGHLWSAIPGKIVHFPADAPGKIAAIPLSAENYLLTTYCSSNGTLWISTAGFLATANGSSLLPQVTFGEEGKSLSFSYITEDKQGRLVGLNRKGIYRFDAKEKKFEPLVVSPELSQIRFITIDRDDFCWITTYGYGNFLYHLPTKKLVKLPVDENNYLLYSHAFIDDGNNNFLVPTNNGLFRLGKENLLQLFRQPGVPLYYQYFDVSDGLLTNEFNGGCYPAYNRLPDGDLLLPALQGLVRVRPSGLTEAAGYPVWVDFIKTKDSSYYLQNDLLFGKEERLQTWHLSVARWNKPNQQNIFYQLDREVWRGLPAGETKILLDGLTGGQHTLRIRYQYGLSSAQFSVSEYRFSIPKRWPEQPIFWLAALALFGSLSYGYVRIRDVQLQQKNRRLQAIIQQNTRELSEKNIELEETLLDLNEALRALQEASVFKNRLIGLVGHDMLIPIRFIANIAGHLNQHVTSLPPQTLSDSSHEIKSTAEQLLFLGENLIYWIKLQEGKFNLVLKTFDLHQLVSEVCAVHKTVMAAKKTRLLWTVSSHLSCRYDPVLVQVILHNLLLNAHKFTVNGDITVEAALSDNTLKLFVTDTGVGMDPLVVGSLNQLKPVGSAKGTGKEGGWGMGYLLIIDLLQLAQGSLHVESQLGRGTKVSILLPLLLN